MTKTDPTCRVVAIDGPAGTGKSTTAREVAERLGWMHVDSGAFYRVASLFALRMELDLDLPSDGVRLKNALAHARIEQTGVAGGTRTILDGEDVTDAIRSPAVTGVVSRVAADPDLRAIVNTSIRSRVADCDAVVDGRDIGTVVFPDAFLKIYLDASIEERARRRAQESEPFDRARDPSVLASYAQSLAERDRADQERPVGALSVPDDAVRIDTSAIDVDAQVAKVLELVFKTGESS